MTTNAIGEEPRDGYDAIVHAVIRSLAALMCGAIALVAYSQAEAFPHVVQKGETLASIAEKIYGRIQYERILVHANALDVCGGTAILPGMFLEVPALGHRRVVSGDTWQSLAKELLGDERRADVLAQANHAKAWQPPEDGAEVIIPYHLRYVVQKDETIVSVSAKFFADNESAWMMDRYNQVGGRVLRRGDTVLVPLTDLPLTDQGKAEASQGDAILRSAGAGCARDLQRKAAAELPALLGEVRGGRYLDAVIRGTRLSTLGELTRPQQAEVHRALTESYAALEAPGLAAASCQALKTVDPSVNLDPIMTSPKVLAACKAAPLVAQPSASAPAPAPSR